MFNYPSSQVYLLRCWQEGAHQRFRVENPHTGERHHFADYAQLSAFMAQTFGQANYDKKIQGDFDENE